MVLRLHELTVVRRGFAIALLFAGLSVAPTVVRSAATTGSEEAIDFEALRARKRELMTLVDQLKNKLPQDLQRCLLIISMKIYTGYCSPHTVREFEDAVNALPAHELASFENEWKRLREHPEWPDTSKLRQSSPKEDAPGREETQNPGRNRPAQ